MPPNSATRRGEVFACGTASGTVGLADLVALFKRYRAHPEARFGRPALLDARAVTAVDLGFSEVFSLYSLISRCCAEAGARMRIAILTADDLTFGIARIFENLAETSGTIQVAIFEEESPARSWLLQADLGDVG